VIIVSTSFQSPMRWPLRELGSTCGDMLMLSWPPAITISASPSRIACAASMTDAPAFAIVAEPIDACEVGSLVSPSRTITLSGDMPNPSAAICLITV